MNCSDIDLYLVLLLYLISLPSSRSPLHKSSRANCKALFKNKNHHTILDHYTVQHAFNTRHHHTNPDHYTVLTALMSCSDIDIDLVNLALDCGAVCSIGTHSHLYDAICEAKESNGLEAVVYRLIAMGADVNNAGDNKGCYPLIAAADCGPCHRKEDVTMLGRCDCFALFF
jgi:hypothetical protein